MDSFARVTAFFSAVMLCFVFSGPLSAFTPPGHSHKLPDIDKRREAQGKPAPVAPQQAVATDKLKGRIPGLKIEHDPHLSTPKHIFSTRGYLSGPNGEGKGVSPARAGVYPAGDRHRGIKAFLDEHAPLFGHGAEVLKPARLRRDATSRHHKFRTTVWEQRLDNITVYDGVLVGNVTSEGELINLSSQFLAEPERAAEAGTPDRIALQNAPTISASQAVLLSAESIEEDLALAEIVALAAQPFGNEKAQAFKAGRLPGEAVARLVWLPMNAQTLRLCWEVELTRRAGGERFRVLIDARSGEAHLRRQLTVYLSDASFRIFNSDSPSPFSPGWPVPSTNQPPRIPRSFVTLSALDTNASPIGWISDGENETRGNNVDAHADNNGDDLPDLPRPQGSPFRVFDPPLDLEQAPGTYSAAATVQLFYWCNWAHDRLYELGFDEASGNFQKDNFGRGGGGNDAIQADAQDGSGFNNANFTPTPDGVPGRIQMFVWNGPNPDIDGDFDAEVVLHEYVHGLSTRLVGGGVGISTLQAAGMGEGWSDFYALALLSEPGDDVDAAYPFGGYASFQVVGLMENYYFGIRRYPYSTDLNKNPLTFKDIDAAQVSPHPGVPMSPIFTFNPINAPEVHSQGEVWCAMLWEARANLVRKHGYSVGNQLILQIVTDGMKLSPPNPSFTQARDAMIMADQVNNLGANYGDLWAAFAKRGLGFSAVAPDSSTTVGIVEAYDLPDSLFVSNPADFVSGGPLGGPFTPSCQIYPLTNLSSTPIAWTAHTTQPWLMVTPSSGTLLPGGATSVSVCVTDSAAEFPLGTFLDLITFSNTVTHVAQSREAQLRIVAFTSMPFAEDFESGHLEPYWSVSGQGAALSKVTPQYNPHGGNYHLTLDSADGTKARNELTLGLDLAGYTNVALKFWAKSFGDEPDGPPPNPFLVGADFDGVALSEDGVKWFEVQSLRLVPSSYTEFVIDLDAAAATHGLRYNPTFRIRFNQVDDFQIPFDGLSIDDISITGTGVRRLTLSTPAQAREGSGVLSTQGTILLGSAAEKTLVVALSSTDPSRVTVPNTVAVPAGSDRASFFLTVLDNGSIEGSVTVGIEARAADYYGGSDSIEISDNETASLKVKLPPKAREGDSKRTELGTVRSDTRPARDVIVRLQSSDPSELNVPASVVIPAGWHSADFELFVVDDNRIDGTRRVTITAQVENWSSGSDTLSVLDNDEPALLVELPPAASERNGTLTNAGRVLLSGTLPTNRLVNLRSSDFSELTVPATIVVPAGQLEARFDLRLVDDSLIDGRQAVTVSAEAPGFASGAASMFVFDDETPPTPLEPQPPNRATNVPVTVTLSWNSGIGNILRNGGFETGDFSGWTTLNTGYGAWVINDGLLDPDGPDGTNAPLSGRFSAVTTQFGGGTHLLFQDVFIPSDALGATLIWTDRIRNHTPYYAANQVFRVEVRDTNNIVLEQLFTTNPGDPLLNDWKQRSFELSHYRGRTVRIAFFEQDSTGYFNVHLDDISVRLSAPETPTAFDVYFGTTPTPGAAELLGNTTNASWSLPRLALNTEYFWQVFSKRGAAVTRGPVWKFTTRGVGPVHHFEWAPIASPQFVDQRFAATLTAKDDINNTVKDFNGQVAITGLPGSGTGSSVVVSEIEIASNDRVEFVNTSIGPVDISGWKISVYDAAFWPNPLTTITLPLGSICRVGEVFQLNDLGEAPGAFPNFHAGTNINWSIAALGNPIAILLQDKGGQVVDFVAAGNANPSSITRPLAIPPEEWNSKPVSAVLSQATLSLQRQGNVDRNEGSDWRSATLSFGSLNAGILVPFSPQSTIAVTPSVLTNFVTGVWSGFLTVRDAAPSVTLRADDGDGGFGIANQFTLGTLNDIGISVTDTPDVVILGESLSYGITVTNAGPSKATGIVLTNLLPSEVSFVSAATFHGVCTNSGQLVLCHLDNLSAGDRAQVTITSLARRPGIVTNQASVIRAEPDSYLRNNFALAVSTISGPSISTTNLNVIEGNNITNLVKFPVRLSAPCSLPVSVNYSTSNFTAVAGLDYRAVAGTLLFPPGVTNLTIDVPVFGDLVDEGFDTFFLNLSSPTNGVIVVTQARCRITDDDLTPSLSISDISLVEGAPDATNLAVFNVRLSAPSGITAGVGFATADRTAVSPSDYLTTFGTLTFPPGVTNQTITVPVRGDNRFEPAETFVVVLANPFGSFLSRPVATASITDDDDGELDHFVWSNIPSPQFVGAPFPATLTARDGLGRTAVGFSGKATVRALADSRQVTVGTGTNTWNSPMGALYHDERTQVIYLAEELGGPGKINALALDVSSLPGQVLTNWTIRLKHTPLVSYGAAVWESQGWTTVYRNSETIPGSGWATFLFDAPFDYDGVNSLLVDFSFDNATYSVSGFVRSSVVTQRRSLSFQTDSAFGDPVTWSASIPPPAITNRIPNVRFVMESPVDILPPGPVQFNEGLWSGSLTVQQPGTNIFLRASDSLGHIANGNLFAVNLPSYSGIEGGRKAVSIQLVQLRGRDVVIRFPSTEGTRYRLERTEDLAKPDWTAVLDETQGTGETLELVDPGLGSAGTRFYRLTILR